MNGKGVFLKVGEIFCCLIAFCLCLSFICFEYLKESATFNSAVGNYTFYLNTPSSNAKIVTVSAKNANERAKRLGKIEGQSLYIDFLDLSKSDCKQFINEQIKSKKARFCFSESGDWGQSYYYFSPQISDYIIINETKVNVHVVVCDKGVSIGSPLIFGSF